MMMNYQSEASIECTENGFDNRHVVRLNMKRQGNASSLSEVVSVNYASERN